MMEGRKPEYPEKSPYDELQKCHILKQKKIKTQRRFKPAQQHWWQSRKADVLTITPRVAHAIYIVLIATYFHRINVKHKQRATHF